MCFFGCRILLLQIKVNGGGHAGSLRIGGCQVEAQSGISDGLSGRVAECGDAQISLFEVFEGTEQTLKSRGVEEHHHVEIEIFVGLEGGTHRAEHDAGGVVEVMRLHVLLNFGVVLVVLWNKEFFSFVLQDDRQEVRPFARFAPENLSLAILHVVLNVVRNGFADDKVFHVIGDVDAQLLTHSEKKVNSVFRGEDDGRIVEYLHSLVSEFSS